ncbi:hypothetical protein AVEN_19187-1 [Araneus ventricosus]|uniref:Uncharacterized protein n=1 Tax=Araneus ventricosus TaxID=182803 RepID=A0A4Y2RZ48_ARAVE|nr:hypothetical protein AVEN_19187-1 [Araneus ventricosus]
MCLKAPTQETKWSYQNISKRKRPISPPSVASRNRLPEALSSIYPKFLLWLSFLSTSYPQKTQLTRLISRKFSPSKDIHAPKSSLIGLVRNAHAPTYFAIGPSPTVFTLPLVKPTHR